jgi:hypothetical protein
VKTSLLEEFEGEEKNRFSNQDFFCRKLNKSPEMITPMNSAPLQTS